jgi:CRISPR-associated protein Csb2
MSIIIKVELLAGRFHAHVWGEAQFAMAGPEWPASPWRLLRALASAWFAAPPADFTPEERDGLIEALGRSPAPEMWLPKTAFREVRYYQPLKLGREKPALHHDFFAVPAGGLFYFVFEVSLSAQHQKLLDILLGRLRYFGRAESRATVRRVEVSDPPCGLVRVLPRNRAVGGSWSPRTVLCASTDRGFQASDLWTSRGDAASEGCAPVHLVDALLSDRKPLPDGALRVEYAQPDGSIVHEILAARARRTPIPEITDVKSVRFRLCRRVPIPISEVVAVARAYREEAVRIFKAGNPGMHSRTLSGREEDGSVSKGNHAFYLPQPAAGGLEIATCVVMLPDGLSLTRSELDALLAVERIRLRWNDRYPITVVPETANCEGPVPSQRWKSLTPFLPPHHHREARAETSPDQQLASCIEASCGALPVHIVATSGPKGLGTRTQVRAHEYGLAVPGSPSVRSWRLTRRFAQWFSVEFTTPVVLAHAVGKDAHFGLGQFAPY